MKKRMIYLTLLTVMSLLISLKSVSSFAEEKKVYFGSWGGDLQTLFEQKVASSFKKQTGYEVVFVPIPTSMEIVARVMAERNSPRLDVVMLDAGPSASARAQGLFAPLDPKIVTHLKDMYDLARIPKAEGVLNLTSACGILYDPEAFEKEKLTPPNSWDDLLLPAFKKRMSVPPPGNTFGLAALLQFAKMGGGSEKNIDPAFELMKKLAPNVLVWEPSYSVFNQLFLSKSIIIGVWDFVTSYLITKAGAPNKFVFPKEGAWSVPVAVNVVKNSPNPAGAQNLVNFMLGEEAQIAYADKLSYGPLNRKVKLPPDVQKRVLTPEMIEKLQGIDWDYVNTVRAQWIERWNKEVAVIK